MAGCDNPGSNTQWWCVYAQSRCPDIVPNATYGAAQNSGQDVYVGVNDVGIYKITFDANNTDTVWYVAVSRV